MTTIPVPSTEARSSLASVLERFERDGVLSEPMVFGRQRRAEGVVIPFELYELLAEPIEQARSAAIIRARINDDAPRITFDQLLKNLDIDPSELESSE